MKFDSRFNRRHVLYLCAFLVTAVLSMQLVAATAWTADDANAGPGVVILQLSGDEDTDWVVADLQRRLSEFITDDPFFVDRVVVRRTDDLHVAETLEGQIVIYASHGGPLGIVTGNRLTSWRTMAQIVAQSGASLHLFTACYSRNIIRHGDDDSGKRLYTVPGARPAEVTNVEITATVMLALGVDADSVENYRTSELTAAKELVETGQSVHIMDFSQIILSEVEAIDETYDDTYTSDHIVYRESVEYFYNSLSGLPADLTSLIMEYFGSYIDENDIPIPRSIQIVSIYYTMCYYIESNYYTDSGNPESLPPTENPPEADRVDRTDNTILSEIYAAIAAASQGYWENSTPVFTGGTYAGYVRFAGDQYSKWTTIYVNVTASGSTENNVDNIHLEQYDVGGVRVERVKVDGVWQDPTADRVTGRTGGLWIDTAADVGYEYDSLWPVSGSAALTGWQYRKAHQLGGAGNSGTNYQVRITVHYGSGTDSGEHVYLNSRCQTDFDDIRFTAGDGNKLLDYWRESYTASSSGVFWVEVSDNLDYDATIYVYYGNPSVSTSSDGAATFIQFDDFNDGSLAGFWATAPGTGTITETGGNLKLSVAAGVNGDWWGGDVHYAPLVYSNAPSTRFEAIVRLNTYTVNLNTHAGMMIYQDRNNAYTHGRFYSSTANNYVIEKIINDGGYGNQGSYQTTATGILLKAKYLAGTYYFDLSLDNGYSWVRLTTESELRPPYIGLFAKEWGSNAIDALFDYWYVRKTTFEPEPSHVSWGGEEYVSMDAWGYRILHAIQGSSGAGTDYQIRITAHYGSGTTSGEHVYLNSHCQTDFDDIRFTDTSGQVLLDYWMETYTASSQAVFWVEVKDSLDTSSSIYIYYGNPSVGSASNGAATFIQFDDFNDNSVSGSWTQNKPVGTITEQWGSSLVMSIGSAVDGNWWGGTVEYAPIIYRAAPSNYYAAVTKLNTYTVNVDTHAGIMAYNNRDNVYLHGRYRSPTYNGYRIEKIISNVGYNSIASYTSTAMNTQLRIREIGSYRYYDISTNGGSSWTTMKSTTELNPTYLGLFTREWGSSSIDSIFDFWYVRKCISSEPAHGSWGNEESFTGTGQGTLESTGDYLYVTGIPSVVGWNGPTFLQSLPSIFELADFGSFSTNISLLHGGYSTRMTQTSVCLYDPQKKPVFRIMVRDGSDSSQSQTLRVIYYAEDGTEYPYESALLSGDFLGVISVRYDPLNGLIVRTPNEFQNLLITHNNMEDHFGRIMKYVGIESERYGSSPEHDERIYSIRVSYSGSDYTVFHEACNDADFLHQDNAFAKTFVKENGEDGDIELWGVYSGSGTITNELVDGDRAIRLQGSGTLTGYVYPYGSSNYWNDPSNLVIQWSMKYSETYTIYVLLDTSAGIRYIQYTPVDTDGLGTGEYVYYGLGTNSMDGRWHTFQRDLAADLKAAQPTVTITDVNAFLIRGSGYIDDIKLLNYQIVKEDAEDGRTTGWGVYSGSGNVYNTLIDERRTIQLSGSGINTGYRCPYSSAQYWNDRTHLSIRWSMKYSETFQVYVSVDTTAGHRYIYYTPVDNDSLGSGEYVHHGLGSGAFNGTWRTFERDLLADLHDAQPTVDIIDVNAFLIRGSGYIDNIMLLPHSSEASLVVPSGQSYIQPSIITRPTTDAWHGGIFVHALDRPFRLYQLAEFSMHGVVDQVASNRMGQTLVGLFDENMKCVFWIYMGDSQGSITRGYFNTAYYPESGGAYYQQSGDLLTDFDKVGCLWYDRGINSIRSTMTGKDVTTLAAVDNPERVIMYMAVSVNAYDDYALLDMRVHDINIQVNARTTPPDIEEPPPGEDPIPVVYDSTSQGAQTQSGTMGADDAAREANKYITSLWILLNLWPVLLTTAQYIKASVEYLVQYTIDLLGNFNILGSELGDPSALGVTQEDYNWFVEYAVPVLAIGSLLTAGLALLTSAEMHAFITAWSPALYVQIAIGLIILGIAVALAISTVNTAQDSGRMTDFQAGWFYFLLSITMFRVVIGLAGVKGILSGFLVLLCVVYWGWWDVLENTLDYLSIVMRWTRYVALTLALVFLEVAVYYWVR